MNRLFKNITSSLFVIFFMLFSTNILIAQNSDIEGAIEIWTLPETWGNGYLNIPINLDTQGIWFGMGDTAEITEFTLITSCGTVEFEGVIDASEATRYKEAVLSTQLECPKITIMRATGKLDGMVLTDLTSNIAIADIKPIPLEILNSGVATTGDQLGNKCPNKTEQLPSVFGTFVDYYCGDYCHVEAKLDNGADISIIANSDVQDILDAPNSVFKLGTKVILTIEREQFISQELGGDCITTEILISISKQ